MNSHTHVPIAAAPWRSLRLVAVAVLAVGCASSSWPSKGPMTAKKSGIDRTAANGRELADWLNDNPTSLARRAKDAAPEALAGKGGPNGSDPKDGAEAPDLEPIMKQAQAALERGDFPTAGALAKQVVTADPKGYPFAWVILGDVALDQHRYEEALDDYQRALALEPHDGWTAQRIAQVLQKLGKHHEARAFLRKFTADNPDADAETWDALAWLELDLGDAKRAEAAFRKALEASNGKDAEAWYGLAMIHARRGDAIALEQDLIALFALEPERRLVIERDPTFFRMRIHPNIAALFDAKHMAEARLAAAKKQKGEKTDAKEAKIGVPGGAEKSLADVIRFDFDSAQIRPESKAVIDEIATFLKAQKSVELVRITGHADRRGDEAYNIRLSEKRALAVRDALVVRGVPATLLLPKGYGVYCPLDDGDDESAYAKNRRVQFAVAAGGKVLGDELTCVERMKKWLKPDASVRWLSKK